MCALACLPWHANVSRAVGVVPAEWRCGSEVLPCQTVPVKLKPAAQAASTTKLNLQVNPSRAALRYPHAARHGVLPRPSCHAVDFCICDLVRLGRM